MEDNIRIVEYEFENVQGEVAFVEEILKEFEIEAKMSWVHEDEYGTASITYYEPICPELYNVLYTCLLDSDNPNHIFADMLITQLIEDMCVLEGCLQLDIDNKKEDTQ